MMSLSMNAKLHEKWMSNNPLARIDERRWFGLDMRFVRDYLIVRQKQK